MTPNEVRDQALRVCTDQASAQAAWERVRSDGRCHGKTARACRLAILQVLANGGTVVETERAGMGVLE